MAEVGRDKGKAKFEVKTSTNVIRPLSHKLWTTGCDTVFSRGATVKLPCALTIKIQTQSNDKPKNTPLLAAMLSTSRMR